MTNPGNAVGTNAAYGGRTSVNAFNDNLATYASPGVLSGWACSPKSGLTIQIGGNGITRDVAIAEDDTGNRTTINNRSGVPIDITLPAAPATGTRIDSIVAYVTNPSQVSTEERVTPLFDNPSVCGIIAVSSAASLTPTAPTESDIRAAITADGGSGTTAYYVELARVVVQAGATDIVNSDITNFPKRGIGNKQDKINYGTSLPSTGFDGQMFVLI